MAPSKLALSFALSAIALSASIVPAFDSVAPDPMNPGQFTWTYTVNTAPDQRLDPGPVPGPSVAGGLGQLPTVASFLTIYDFADFTGVANLQGSWGLVTYVNGSTPTDTIPTDGVTANLTAYWTGPQTIGGASYVFAFNSRSSVPGEVSFTSQATKASGLFAGNVVDQVGTTAGPVPTPEPGTYATMGVGLLAAIAVRRRQMRRA